MTSFTSCRGFSSTSASHMTVARPTSTSPCSAVRSSPCVIRLTIAGAEHLVNPALLTDLRKLEFGYPVHASPREGDELGRTVSTRDRLSLRVYKT